VLVVIVGVLVVMLVVAIVLDDEIEGLGELDVKTSDEDVELASSLEVVNWLSITLSDDEVAVG
jgi:hypothetical protein